MFHRLYQYISKGRYTSEFASQFLYFILKLLGGVLVGAYVARYLGPEDIGVIGILLAVGAMVSPLIEMGSRQILVKDFSQRTSRIADTFWTLLVCRFILAIIVTALLFSALKGGVISSLERQSTSVIAVGVSILLFNPLTQFRCILTAEVKNKVTLKIDLLILLLGMIVSASAVFLKLDLLHFILIPLVVGILNLTTTVWGVWKEGLLPIWTSFDLEGVRKLLAQSWPLMLSSVALITYTKLDTLMIAHYLPLDQVGLYYQSVKLFELLFFFPIALHGCLSSKIYELLKEPANDSKTVMYHVFPFYGLVSLGVLILAVAVGPLVIPILYGSSFLAVSGVFVILALSLPAYSLGGARDNYLIHEGITRFSLLATCLGCLVNLCANFLLIPRWGIQGAAVASVLSYYVAAILTSTLLRGRGIFRMQLLSFVLSPSKVKASYKFVFSSK